MPASIAAYIISVRASMSVASLTARTRILADALQRLGRQAVGKRIRALRHRAARTARRIRAAAATARAVSDSSAWLMQSKPLAATTLRGSVAVTVGSISAMVGIRRREMMPVLALIVGQVEDRDARRFRSGARGRRAGDVRLHRPGTFCPPPIGALT